MHLYIDIYTYIYIYILHHSWLRVLNPPIFLRSPYIAYSPFSDFAQPPPLLPTSTSAAVLITLLL